MEKYRLIYTVCMVLLLIGCQSTTENNKLTRQCDINWYQQIESAIHSTDDAGHGPDVGSDEWKSVVEFKLSVRGQDSVPAKNAQQWCQYIDVLVKKRESLTHQGPSFDCSESQLGSAEDLICSSKALSRLDRQMAAVYQQSVKKVSSEQQAIKRLKAEQHGWRKGRDDCWKADDQAQCIAQHYQRRIATLQANYQLVNHSTPQFYHCDNNSNDEVIVTLYDTEPVTLIAERGDSVSMMFIVPSASGSKYVGRNESFWQHHDEATVVWGYQAAPMTCKKAQ